MNMLIYYAENIRVCFFPREGLSAFYVMDSDSHRMREYNTQLSDLSEEIHQSELLKIVSFSFLK